MCIIPHCLHYYFAASEMRIATASYCFVYYRIRFQYFPRIFHIQRRVGLKYKPCQCFLKRLKKRQSKRDCEVLNRISKSAKNCINVKIVLRKGKCVSTKNCNGNTNYSNSDQNQYKISIGITQI